MIRSRMVKNINFFWASKKLFLTYLKTVFRVTEHFSINELFEKMSFSARKMHFFDKNSNIYPSSPLFTCDVKELFFPMIISSLNSEGLFGARWRTWWNPPRNIFNLAKNRPCLEEFKKKFSNVTGTIYIKCMLPKYIMIHCFWTTLLLKMSQF